MTSIINIVSAEETKIMRFNADRLAALAGVNPNGQSNGMLNEASNRSMHDDPSLKGDDEYRFGKNQLAEDAKLDGPPDVSPEEEEAFLSQGMSEDKHGDEELDEDKHGDEELDEDKHGDEVVEIDEAMLKKEILKMPNKEINQLLKTMLEKLFVEKLERCLEPKERFTMILHGCMVTISHHEVQQAKLPWAH